MASWKLNTLRFGGDEGHPNHHLRIHLHPSRPQILRPPTKTIGFQTFSPSFQRKPLDLTRRLDPPRIGTYFFGPFLLGTKTCPKSVLDMGTDPKKIVEMVGECWKNYVLCLLYCNHIIGAVKTRGIIIHVQSCSNQSGKYHYLTQLLCTPIYVYIIPIESMYGVFTYIWLICMVN